MDCSSKGVGLFPFFFYKKEGIYPCLQVLNLWPNSFCTWTKSTVSLKLGRHIGPCQRKGSQAESQQDEPKANKTKKSRLQMLEKEIRRIHIGPRAHADSRIPSKISTLVLLFVACLTVLYMSAIVEILDKKFKSSFEANMPKRFQLSVYQCFKSSTHTTTRQSTNPISDISIKATRNEVYNRSISLMKPFPLSSHVPRASIFERFPEW